MLHVFKAAESLPVWVLDPHFEQCFVAQVESGLEVKQANDNAGVEAEPSDFLNETGINFLIECGPPDFGGEDQKWVIRVEELIKMGLEEVRVGKKFVWVSCKIPEKSKYNAEESQGLYHNQIEHRTHKSRYIMCFSGTTS